MGARGGQALPRVPPRAGWSGAAGSPSQCHVGAPLPVSCHLSGAGAVAALPRGCAGVQSLGASGPGCSWAPPGEQQLIPTSLLLGSHPRAGDRDPRPRQQPRTVLPGREEAPKAPPAPAGGLTARGAPCTHTGRHGHRHLLAGRMPPVPPVSVWLQGGEARSSSQRSQVTGARFFFLELGKVR